MPTLLFVDDNEMLRTFASRNLEMDIPRLRVIGASGCAEARRRVAEEAPDVVVMDQRLGDGNGIELMRELAAVIPRSPFLVVSADAAPSMRQRALAAGAFDVLSKPYETSVLVAAVRRAIANSFAEGTAGRDPSAANRSTHNDDLGRVRHRVLNRLSALLAGLRAFEGDLRDAAGDGDTVNRIADRYCDRLVSAVLEVSDLLRGLPGEDEP